MKKEQPLPLVTSYKLATKWNLVKILDIGERKRYFRWNMIYGDNQ